MAVSKKHMKTAHHVKDLNLAPKGHGRIEWAERSMPVLASIRERLSKDEIARRGTTLWRYKELLPLPEHYDSSLPVGFTPLVKAAGLKFN